MKKKFINNLALGLTVTLSLGSFPYNVFANTSAKSLTNLINYNSSLNLESDKIMKTTYIEDSSIYTNSKDIGIIRSTYKAKSPSDFINLAFVQNFDANLNNYLVEYENNIAFINIYNSTRDKHLEKIPVLKNELINEGESSSIFIGETDKLRNSKNIESFNNFIKENPEFIIEVDYLVDNNKLHNNTFNINFNFSSNLINLDSKDYMIYELNYNEEKMLNNDNKLHIYFSNKLEDRKNLNVHYIIKIGKSLQHVYINNGKLSIGESIDNIYFKEVKKISDYNISLELLDNVKIPKDTRIEIYKTNNGIQEDICFMKIYNGLNDDNVRSCFEFNDKGLYYYFYKKELGKIIFYGDYKFSEIYNNEILFIKGKYNWNPIPNKQQVLLPVHMTTKHNSIVRVNLNEFNLNKDIKVLTYNVVGNKNVRLEEYYSYLRFEKFLQNKYNNKVFPIENSKQTSSITIEKNNNIIKLNANGGYFTNDKSEITVEKIKLTTVNKPLKPKMKFLGWSKDKGASKPDTEILNKLDDLSTIYAVWKEDANIGLSGKAKILTNNPKDSNYRKVEFKTNRGELEGNSTYWVHKDEEIEITPPKIIDLKNHEFSKWDPDLKNNYTSDTVHNATFKYVGENIIKWDSVNRPDVPDNFVEIKFDKGKFGEFFEDEVVNFLVNPDVKIKLEEPKIIPIDGYRFVGCDKSTEGIFKENTIINAKYDKIPDNEKYSVSAGKIEKEYGSELSKEELTSVVETTYPKDLEEQPKIALIDNLPSTTSSGTYEIRVNVKYPDGSEDNEIIEVVIKEDTRKDNEKYSVSAGKIEKEYGSELTEEDIINSVKTTYPKDLEEQPEIAIIDNLPNTTVSGTYEVKVNVKYPDKSTSEVFVEVLIKEDTRLDNEKYSVNVNKIEKEYGSELTEAEVISAVETTYPKGLEKQPKITLIDNLPSITSSGTYKVKVNVKYPDGSEDNSIIVIVIKEDTRLDNEKHNPILIQEQIETYIGEIPEAKRFIDNIEKLPKSTSINWKSSPIVDDLGISEGTILILYPDGSFDELSVKFNVVNNDEEEKTKEEKNPEDIIDNTKDEEEKTKDSQESKDDTENEFPIIEEHYQDNSWDEYLISEPKEDVFTKYIITTKPKELPKETQKIKNTNYIKGYEDGTFRPDNNITRAEASAMISRINGYISNNTNEENENWYDEVVHIMASRDLILPDENGDLRANEAITRAELVRALYHIDERNEKISPFSDVKGHKYEKAINQAFGNKRISGYPDGTFRPDEKITRAEVVIILNNYANIEVNKTNKNIFKDLNENHWAYDDILSAVSK